MRGVYLLLCSSYKFTPTDTVPNMNDESMKRHIPDDIQVYYLSFDIRTFIEAILSPLARLCRRFLSRILPPVHAW